MRLKYFKNKIIPQLFILLLLFQSCSVYQKTGATLDEAVKSNARVRIERNDQKKINLKKIEYTNGKYFGIKKVNGEIVSIPIDQKDIKSIRVIDKTKTNLAYIGLAVISVAVIVIAILINDLNNGLNNIGGGGLDKVN